LEFCSLCYRENKEDIKGKKPWVRVIKNAAQKERRRKIRESNDTSLEGLLENRYNKYR
jgi:hypothetical protein